MLKQGALWTVGLLTAFGLAATPTSDASTLTNDDSTNLHHGSAVTWSMPGYEGERSYLPSTTTTCGHINFRVRSAILLSGGTVTLYATHDPHSTTPCDTDDIVAVLTPANNADSGYTAGGTMSPLGAYGAVAFDVL